MDWGLGFFPEPAGKTVAFNQLLDKVRSVHDEVCARNALLESQAVQNGDHGPFSSTKDDPWLPTKFMAPEDGPPPYRPQGDISTHTGLLDLQAADILARQQEHLTRSIDKLAKQQETLCEQIAKMFAMSALAESSRPPNAGFKCTPLNARSTLNAGYQRSTQRGTRRIGKSVAMQEDMQGKAKCGTCSSAVAASMSAASAAPRASAEDAAEASRAMLKERQEAIDQAKKRAQSKSRFAVQTGGTQEFVKESFFRKSVVEAITNGNVVKIQRYLQHILSAQYFTVVTGALIMSYTALIAIETNMIAQDPEMDATWIKALHYVYTAIFTGELMIRFLANGRETWYGEDRFWNRLDTFLICTGLVEILLENTVSANVPGVRIGRMIRTVRLIRTFHNFHDFQKMVYALIASFKTLICSLALLIFVMFFFAVWLTQSAANLQMRDQIQDLGLRYGDLLATTYTLFLSVSGGISWDLCYMPLHYLSWWSASGFMLYIVIVLFGLLNVITSVFVESVIRSVQHYKDIIVQDKEEERQIAIGHMKEVFRAVDSDGSGYVSIDEMEYFLQDPALRKYMDALDVEAGDTRLLFRLLDCDGSGVIDVDEFCEGCLRLKGSAKSIDVHVLIFRVKNFLDKWSDFTEFVVTSFSDMRNGHPPSQDFLTASMALKDGSGSRALKPAASAKPAYYQ